MNTGAIIFDSVKKVGGTPLFLVRCASGEIKEGDVLHDQENTPVIKIIEIRPISKKSKKLTKGVTGGLIVEFLSGHSIDTLKCGAFLVARST